MSRNDDRAPHSILWRILKFPGPGHEHARIAPQGAFWRLSGTAVFAYEGKPGRLDYSVSCGADGRTLGGQVSGWLGEEAVEIEYSVNSSRQWRLGGVEQPAVEGCLDVDLNFSPSTNLLPIRRLNLEVGQEATVRAAWLRFPSFTFEPLEQVYRRLGPTTYRYESAGGKFFAELEVDESGFVTRYPGLWESEG
jgi:hypothetical protein